MGDIRDHAREATHLIADTGDQAAAMQCSTASLGTIPAVTASATHDYHDGTGVAGYRSNSASTSDEEMRRSIL